MQWLRLVKQKELCLIERPIRLFFCCVVITLPYSYRF
jgi:hypothetical protein